MAKRSPISVVSSPQANTHTSPDDSAFGFTDIGIARRFIARHGECVRYSHGTRCWYVFDGSKWRIDDTGQVMRWAKESVQALKDDSRLIEDAKQRRATEKHVRSCESLARLKAMIETAQSESEIIVREEDFDTDPHLLGCKNGLIDLMRMDLIPMQPTHLVSKISPVLFDTDAESMEWLRFLDQSTEGDAALQAFIQRAVGYSLFGSNEEEKLFFVYGPGASGKSTFIEAIKMVFGDYARTADFSSFLRHRSSSGPRDDLARLRGARLVVANEVYKGAKLSEATIKMLTGGDTIVARALYQEAQEWKPQFTLWLVANDPPLADQEDDALWRRILCLPFTRSVPENQRDPYLKRLLCDPSASGPGILNWALQGCQDYLEKGLAPPDSVLLATEAYRQEGDQVEDWMAEACYESTSVFSASADLYRSYETWALDHALKPMSQKALSRALKQRGFHTTTRRIAGVHTRGFIGLELI